MPDDIPTARRRALIATLRDLPPDHRWDFEDTGRKMGDYAVLYRHGRFALSWLRQAGILLCAIIFIGSIVVTPLYKASAGGVPKGQSENSNKSSSDSRNKTIMGTEQSDQTNELRFDDASDDEAIFIGIIGGLFGSFFMYAVVKRIGDRIFGPQKYRG